MYPSHGKATFITENVNFCYKVMPFGLKNANTRYQRLLENVIGGCKILLDYFYRQLVYVGDGCVEYECMKLKRNDDEKKMFSSFWNLIVKVWLSWMQLFVDFQMKSLPCYVNQGNQDLLMRLLLWCMINLCNLFLLYKYCMLVFFLKKSLYY